MQASTQCGIKPILRFISSDGIYWWTWQLYLGDNIMPPEYGGQPLELGRREEFLAVWNTPQHVAGSL